MKIPPRPTSLASMVEADPGSVTSRVLNRSDACTQTLFAFAEGEGLTEHTSPHTADILVLDGSLEMTLRHADDRGSVRHQICAGEIFRIPPNVPHELHGGEPFKMVLSLVKTRPEEAADDASAAYHEARTKVAPDPRTPPVDPAAQTKGVEQAPKHNETSAIGEVLLVVPEAQGGGVSLNVGPRSDTMMAHRLGASRCRVLFLQEAPST